LVGQEPTFRQLASKMIADHIDTPTVIAIDNFTDLAKLVNLLLININIVIIIINITNYKQINIIAKVQKTLPDIKLLGLYSFSVENKSLFSVPAHEISEVSKRDEASSGSAFAPVGKLKIRLHSDVEGRNLSLAEQGIKPLHLEQPKLTKREIEIIQLIYNGYSYLKCARAMNISLSTVQTHIRNTYRKLAVSNNRQAILKAHLYGLLSIAPEIKEAPNFEKMEP
jgi:DNA-binding NarL/FixJ family response regulator